MFPYPTPAPDINDQFQSQGTAYNKPGANFTWTAVPGRLDTINTNNHSQYGYVSESPMVMSASSLGYSSLDLAFPSRPNFNFISQPNFPTEWPWPNAQHGSFPQSLVPSGNTQAREVLAKKLRTLVHLFLRTRLILRNVRQKRRHSFSDCQPWTTGSKNVGHPGPSLDTSCSDYGGLGDISNEFQTQLFNYSDYTNCAWTDNPLGIWNSGENLLSSPQECIPRKVTELHEDDAVPRMERELPGLLVKPNVSENATIRPQRKVSNLKRSKKRPIECAGIEGSSDDDTDEGLRGTKRPRGSSTARRFACPFYKHDPVRYGTSRSCVGPGWNSVHRVKEHVFRSHRLPEHRCLRCFKAFESAKTLSEHSRSSVLCEVQSGTAQEEGIDASQEKQLHIRAKKNNAASHVKTVEENRWNDMYKIIFPNEEQPSSPYYNSAQLTIDKFGRNIMDDFGQRLSAKVGCLGIQPALLDKILTMLQETVQSCQQGGENPDSGQSQLTATQPQLSQSSPSTAQPMACIGNNMLDGVDDQLAQMLFDPTWLGISNSGFWSTL